MTRALAIVLLAVATWPAAFSWQTGSPATASITGVVVLDEPDVAAVRRVTVRLEGDTLTVARISLTDDRGQFLFERLPAGRYTLTATRPGYVPAAYGSTRGWRSTGRPVALATGERRAGLTIRMLRGAVITGRARDSPGRPVAGVRIRVGELRTMWGEPTFREVPGRTVVTDDRGVYRVYGLPPGRFILAAQPPSSSRRVIEVPEVPAEADAHVGYVPIYYPGTTDPAEAEVLVLTPGQERSGLDLEVRTLAMATISGVVRSPSGEPAPRAIVRRAPAIRAAVGATSSGWTATTGTDAQGAFSLNNVPPGQHIIQALGQEELWARLPITVDGRPVRNVELQLQPGVAVSGRVVADGQPDAPLSGDWAGATVGLLPWSSGGVPTGSARARLRPDGSFESSRIVPGSYHVTLTRPAGSDGHEWMMLSARFGSVDLTADPLEVLPGGGASGIVITVTDRIGEISGRLMDANGAPAPEYVLLVFPADRRLWSPGPRRMRDPVSLGADGRYRVSGLPPGDYFVAALTDLAAGDHLDPDFLDLVVPGAIRVSLGKGERKVQDIRLATR